MTSSTQNNIHFFWSPRDHIHPSRPSCGNDGKGGKKPLGSLLGKVAAAGGKAAAAAGGKAVAAEGGKAAAGAKAPAEAGGGGGGAEVMMMAWSRRRRGERGAVRGGAGRRRARPLRRL